MIDSLVLRVRDAIFTPIASLRIDALVTPEPVPYALRSIGRHVRPAVGETWGDELFDCAWMRFAAEWPPQAGAGTPVARIDVNGELCLVNEWGEPVRGLTSVKSTFDPTLGGPGKTIYRLPPAACAAGRVELWADAGLNDLFGFIQDGGRVALAEIALLNEEVRQLYYDLETLRDFHLTLPPDDPLARRLTDDLAALGAGLDCASPESVVRARHRLAGWFANAEKPPLRVHAVGHAHLDLAWLWPLRETIRKGARTFATALYNIERHPGYVFGCSQPQLFAWMKESHPALYARIRSAVGAGRIEPLGTFWVEPDCNMPSGESFVRQTLLGVEFFEKEFGIVPRHCWQPDVFGYHGQLPQILRLSGHEFFMTQKLSWNLINRFTHHSFHWEGIDGTRILTHMLPEETYNSPAGARSLRKMADGYLERDVSGHALMVFGIGDGGGGPDAEHLERLDRAPRLPGLPAVTVGKAEAFFDAWRADADKFPVWRGELYLERHQGTLTTQALAKRNNRRAEIALRELEWAGFLAARLARIPWPAEALDRIWKETLLYQFHDVLPGSSIKRVYDECNARYADMLAELERLTRERYAAVAAALDTAEDAIAFNSLAWPRHDWIASSRGWRRPTIPPLGWAALGGATPSFYPPRADATCLENEYLRVRFSPDGRIASLLLKRSGREIMPEGAFGNDLVVITDTGDAWDYEADHARKDVWGYLRRPVERPALVSAEASVDGPCAILRQTRRHRDSTIRQTLRLFAGEEALVFETEIDWREPASMLRVRFPVAVNADEASFEIPFGHIRRSTREDTSLHKAQFEAAALQWVDLSEDEFGVSLYNDCKHGFRVKDRTLDMAILRSVPHPGAALIGKGDRSETAAKVYTDLGEHALRYALRPHDGPLNAAQATAEARAFNTPLTLIEPAGAERLAAGQPPPAPFPMLALPGDTALPTPTGTEAELVAFKLSADGGGWIARLVNVSAQPIRTGLAWPGHVWREVDLHERPVDSAQRESAVDFRPFEIKTFRFEDARA